MTLAFRALVDRLLPHEDRLLAHVRDLKGKELRAVLDSFSVTLPEFDAVVALPHAAGVGQALASLRGASLLSAQQGADSGRWGLEGPTDDPIRSVVLLTEQFTTGLPELELTMLAEHQGWRVVGVAAVIERTNAGGRARLELHGVPIYPAAQVADTPRGLVLERRFPQAP